MSDQTPETDQTPEGESSTIRDLRQRAADKEAAEARAKAAEEKAAKLERTNVLHELGIKPDSTEGMILARMHDGDWEVDKVRETAAQYKLLPSATTPEQQAAAQRTAEVSAGAEHTTAGSDWQAEFAKLPKYGQQGWEETPERALELAAKFGAEVSRTKPKQATWVNPVTGQKIRLDRDTPAVTPRGE